MKKFMMQAGALLTLVALMAAGCASKSGRRVSPSAAGMGAPAAASAPIGTATNAANRMSSAVAFMPAPLPGNTEQYDVTKDSSFKDTLSHPQSTFSIDVDTASYSNVRRFLNERAMPPADAVRIEELINYFSYAYAPPTDDAPLAVHSDMSACPWRPEHKLIRIGMQAKHVDHADIPPSNLVFLIDVSGSMQDANKLPLLKEAFTLLVKKLRPQDRVAIVVYAGAAGLVLPGTPGGEKAKILSVLASLEAGGSTAGMAGIQLAYSVAKEGFISGGNNRVIIATDGDFNVGASSDGELVRLIEDKRRDGVFLTVLGFGMGNYKDAKLEKLADSGNGNHAYIDNLLEANKVMNKEFAATMLTVAKDVKLQIEFNPAKVRQYRLIGYENRALNAEDFEDDQKDAGELGADQSVTALYEIIPATTPASDKKLKYVSSTVDPNASASPEIMTVSVRYKAPKDDASRLITIPVREAYAAFEATSPDFRFASAVAEFGLLLRDSEFKGNASYQSVLERAKQARGVDDHGYRAEFIRLVETAEILSAK